ncbi:MAG: DUF2715 domain-containing protein [Bacteroidetes bacterium]|nr:DUF2715 domain-containing protein [Bacteroidota bacterium]
MKQIIACIAFFLSVHLSAQLNSVVYLKNGSAIRGEVTKNDSTGVSLKTRDGSYWNFQTDEVIRVEKYAVEIRPSGFYNKTSFGIMGGDQLGASLRVVNGYTFNPHWDLGLGVGLESFLWDPYIPIFAEGRYSIFQGSTRPFVSAHAGYELPLRNMEFNKGGLTAGIDVGITHYFSNHVGISTSAGYRYAYLRENNSWWDDFVTISQINRFEIRLGFVFR